MANREKGDAMDAVVPLDAAADVAVSGSKAADLAALMGLGVEVPEGVVVPTSVVSTYAAGRAPDDLPDALPDEVLEALYGSVGCVEPVAVSAVPAVCEQLVWGQTRAEEGVVKAGAALDVETLRAVSQESRC